jgi:hypothetical protein
MNRYANIGCSCATVALIALAAASLSAQQTAPRGGAGGANPPATQGGGREGGRQGGGRQGGGTTGAQPAQPAQPAQSGRQGGRGRSSSMDQGPAVPAGTTVTTLGAVHLGKAVKADGQPLPVGTYQLRVTEREASPAAAGQTPEYERWAEFLQNGQVKGREVVTVVPQSDIAAVAEDRPPRPGAYRVDVLKGGDYYRLWYNKGGTHYLVHFNIAS